MIFVCDWKVILAVAREPVKYLLGAFHRKGIPVHGSLAR
jgi:hypothetical protein